MVMQLQRWLDFYMNPTDSIKFILLALYVYVPLISYSFAAEYWWQFLWLDIQICTARPHTVDRGTMAMDHDGCSFWRVLRSFVR
jgi:hypothetical protein